MTTARGSAGRHRRPGPANDRRAARLPALLLTLALAAPALQAADAPGKAAAPKEDLAAVRKQIQSLQQSLEKAEGSRAEVTDALRESEQAISATQRRLHQLEGERKRINQKLDELGRDADTTQTQIDAQRERISGLLQRQYLRGDDDALRLMLKGSDPADLGGLLPRWCSIQ